MLSLLYTRENEGAKNELAAAAILEYLSLYYSIKNLKPLIKMKPKECPAQYVP